ncbi:MAG: pitrilysin family protein [Planctomycetota bacterium]
MPDSASDAATIQTHTFPNGLTLLAEPMAAASSVAVTLMVPAGVAQQPEQQQGVAPLMADFVTRGAGGMSARDHSDALDRLGVQRSTDAQSRYFVTSGVMLGRNLEAGLPLLLDTALRPNLDDAAFGPCRDLALQAIDALQDEPQQRAMLELRAKHLPTPLGRSPLGVREQLEAMTADDARAFWAERCVSTGAVLSVAGAVDVRQLIEEVGGIVADWSGQADTVAVGSEPPRVYTHGHDDSTQLHVAVGYGAMPETHEDAMLQKAAVAVLSGGMSGRLFTEVREKRGLVYSVYARYVGQKDRGDVYAYAGTTTPRAQETLDVLVGELRRLSDGVMPEEFDRAIVGMKSRLVMQGESTEARSGALAGDYVTFGYARSLGQRAAQVDAVTLDKLNDFVASHRPEAMTVVTLGQEALTPPEGVAATVPA